MLFIGRESKYDVRVVVCIVDDQLDRITHVYSGNMYIYINDVEWSGRERQPEQMMRPKKNRLYVWSGK